MSSETRILKIIRLTYSFSMRLPYFGQRVKKIKSIIKKKFSSKKKTESQQEMQHYQNLHQAQHLAKSLQHHSSNPQPLYGNLSRGTTQKSCVERADAILQNISCFGPTFILDVGCRLGYFAYYFAERHYHVHAIDANQTAIKICNLLKQYNEHHTPQFFLSTFNLEYVQNMSPDKYNIIFLLSVIHHITIEKGIDYVQALLVEIFNRVPIMIIELVHKHEHREQTGYSPLPDNELDVFNKCDDITITKIGSFATASKKFKRNLYIAIKNKIQMRSKNIDVITRKFIAHEDASYSSKYFIETDRYFIKYYNLNRYDSIDKNQTQNELHIYHLLPENNVFPKMIDLLRDQFSVTIVFEKIPGITLKHYLEKKIVKLDAENIILQLLKGIKILKDLGFYHNDIRTHNIMLLNERIHLIDLGYTSTREIEDTITAVLWIFYQLHFHVSIDATMHYPYVERPKINLEALPSHLKPLIHRLMIASSLDHFFSLAPY